MIVYTVCIMYISIHHTLYTTIIHVALTLHYIYIRERNVVFRLINGEAITQNLST